MSLKHGVAANHKGFCSLVDQVASDWSTVRNRPLAGPPDRDVSHEHFKLAHSGMVSHVARLGRDSVLLPGDSKTKIPDILAEL